MIRNQRSPEAQAWRRLYKTPRWQRLSAAHLQAHPYCVRCLAHGDIVDCSRGTKAGVVDHILEHKGDWDLMFDAANLQTLCHRHHSSAKQSEERIGFSTEVEVDGWPVESEASEQPMKRKQRVEVRDGPDWIEAGHILSMAVPSQKAGWWFDSLLQLKVIEVVERADRLDLVCEVV